MRSTSSTHAASPRTCLPAQCPNHCEDAFALRGARPPPIHHRSKRGNQAPRTAYRVRVHSPLSFPASCNHLTSTPAHNILQSCPATSFGKKNSATSVLAHQTL